MKDLIKRLRARADENDTPYLDALILREAANELERLTEELAHSEWLRNRSSEVYHRYQRTGEDTI